jgi:DNA-binding NarL/FixJ family response regulator
MPVTRITVFLSEDHMIVREGLRALLEAESDIHIVGEAENGRQAVERVAKLHPQVVVMDIAMPLLNGLEATRQILSAAPETRVIILSAYSDDAYVGKAMEIGAWGFLVKQTAAHVLPLAIRKVHKGTKYFSPSISKRLSYQQNKSHELGQLHPKKDASQLSPREMEVLQLIAEGKANKETADVLHISVKTVEKHRQRLMDKLNIHDTASLTRYAISAGVIESSVQSSTSGE